MKHLLLIILFPLCFSCTAQNNYFVKKGYVAKGYDVVSYFENKAEEGLKKYTTSYDGVKFKFRSKEHLEAFKGNPKKYIPQYGGYCAYAIAQKGKKVSIDPETFEIRDGKLYLFYNSWGTNTLEMWIEEDAQKLQKEADLNWQKMIKK